MRQLKVLSLFDRLDRTRQALKELNIDCQYYVSDVGDNVIKFAKANHSDIIHLGDVRCLEISIEPFNWSGTIKDEFLLPNCDLITTGCDRKNMLHTNREFDLLIAGSLDDRPELFDEYLRILDEVQPKYHVINNVVKKLVNKRYEVVEISQPNNIKNILKHILKTK